MLALFSCATVQAMDYTAVFTGPPKNIPTYYMPDGPLLGNGDLGIALAGAPEEQRFYIGKNDWWGYGDGSRAMPVGGLTLAIAELKGASYRQEQDLALAEVRGVFTNGEVGADAIIRRHPLQSAGDGIEVCRDKACDGRAYAEKWFGRALGNPPYQSSRRCPVLHAEEPGRGSRE